MNRTMSKDEEMKLFQTVQDGASPTEQQPADDEKKI